MSWFESLDNPKAIACYYKAAPSLDAIEISNVAIRCGGLCHYTRIELQLEQLAYPDSPSKRWDKADDAVIIKLEFFDIQGLEIRGWENRNLGMSLTLSRSADGRACVMAENKDVLIRFTCGTAYVFDVVSYKLRESL